jgi:acetyl-CoA synthetase
MMTTTATTANAGIDSVLNETRTFQPHRAASLGMPRWHIASLEEYHALHRRSIEDPEGFWGGVAQELYWHKPWTKVLDWNPPDAKWFVGGKTNLCYNCVDRQVEHGHGDDVAIIWEGEPITGDGTDAKPEVRRLTYKYLQQQTGRMANALKELGVKKGDVVTIYMGMVPELAIAMLACARIGAHTPSSSAASPPRPSSTASTTPRARSSSPATAPGDAGPSSPSRQCRRRVRRTRRARAGQACHRLPTLRQPARLEPRPRQVDGLDSSPTPPTTAPASTWTPRTWLFLLYTSGSTGKPKGILHTIGGYMVYTYLTAKYIFNLVPDVGQVYWCTADIGWVTGHSYIVYGILPNRVPSFMYEGAPNSPDPARFWDIIERHKITQFYTAPTAIRAFMKWGDEHPEKHDLSSLKVLGSVGEPINPEAWMWYHRTSAPSGAPSSTPGGRPRPAAR